MNDQITNMNPAASRPIEVVLTRKPRCDSPLRQLPEPRQAEIVEQLKTTSLAGVRTGLAATGVKTSLSSLSKFRSWYLKRMEQRTTRVTEMLADMEAICRMARGRNMSGVTDAQLTKLTVRYLSIRALADRDSVAWVRVHGLRIKGERVKLQKRRMALQDRFLALRDRRVDLLERAEARRQAKAANAGVNSTTTHDRKIGVQHATLFPAMGSEAENQKCAGKSAHQTTSPLMQPAQKQNTTSDAPTSCNLPPPLPPLNGDRKT